MLKGVRRLDRFQYRIGGNFQRSIDQHGSIFLRRREHFPQSFEEAFLLRGSDQRIAFGNNPVLYPLLSNDRILFGNYFFNLRGGKQAIIRLAQHPQHLKGILIFLMEKTQQTVCPQILLIVRSRQRLHLLMHKHQRKKKNRQQQYIADGYFQVERKEAIGN